MLSRKAISRMLRASGFDELGAGSGWKDLYLCSSDLAEMSQGLSGPDHARVFTAAYDRVQALGLRMSETMIDLFFDPTTLDIELSNKESGGEPRRVRKVEGAGRILPPRTQKEDEDGGAPAPF